MRRTSAVLTTVLVTVLTFIGASSPADAAPIPAPSAGCTLQATANLSGTGITTSVKLAFSSHGVTFLVPPAWSYEIRSGETHALVAAKSFGPNNNQQDTINTSGWTTGTYTADAEFGDSFPTCTTTFQLQGVDDSASPTPVADHPPTATIACGPAEIVVGGTINVKGTAHDDHGIATDKIRLPDGTDRHGNTGTWEAQTVGEVAFAYFATDTAGHQANALCRVNIVPAAQTQPETSPAPSTPVPAPRPTTTAPADTEVVSAQVAETDDSESGVDTDELTSTPDSAVGDDPEPEVEGGDELPEEAATADDEPGDTVSTVVDSGQAIPTELVEPPAQTTPSPANAFADLIEIAETLTANELAAAEPVAVPASSPTGINVPWWFLGLVLTLAAYKPLSDLWRSLTSRPETVSAG